LVVKLIHRHVDVAIFDSVVVDLPAWLPFNVFAGVAEQLAVEFTRLSTKRRDAPRDPTKGNCCNGEIC
jgi:hypothetical protein